jgi:hypothetical protein
MLQVFLLNMAYDFGLKQISFHLLVHGAVLLAPDVPRLPRVFLGGRGPSTQAPLFPRRAPQPRRPSSRSSSSACI